MGGRTHGGLFWFIMMDKCLLIPMSSLSRMGVSVLRSSHGEEDNPSNNKIIMITVRTAIIISS